MSNLDRQVFYTGIRKDLKRAFGKEKADRLWEAMGREYDSLLAENPWCREHKGSMAVPAVAIYRVLEQNGKDAESILNAYGDRMGMKFATIVHGITSIPGVSKLLWKHVDGIMDTMSGEKLGYKRRIVSEPPAMFGVDILSCPYHEICKELGNEKAVLCICHMDKKYMQGFKHIRYERTTAVSEGAEYCDYRLRYNRSKK